MRAVKEEKVLRAGLNRPRFSRIEESLKEKKTLRPFCLFILWPLFSDDGDGDDEHEQLLLLYGGDYMIYSI